MKEPNKAQKAAEALEERPRVKGNLDDMAPAVAQYTGKGSIGLAGIREAAERGRDIRFTSLMHHITIDLLWDAYDALKRNAAPGVDEVTWTEFQVDTEARIRDLHVRLHSERYRAKPSKRIYLPKPNGQLRPIGIAALEDKIVQQAVVWVLTQIYEVDFLGYSYGFRPGRSQHNALDAIYVGITRRKVSWVLDADIKGFFDNIKHDVLMNFLEKRIADRRMLRLIQKWLRAGVSDEGEWSKTEVGTPQGAVISPLLANIYLHYSLDLWVNQWRKVRANGDVVFVRYADDSVAGFQHRQDAEAFLESLKARLAEVGLKINEDKTRLIEFGRFADENRRRRGAGKPETFDFLGFTHFCGTTHKNKKFTVRRKTIAKRMRSKLSDIRQKLMKMRHKSIHEVGKWLRSVVRGYYNYFGVPGNWQSMASFQYYIRHLWFYALRRRSQKARKLSWKKFGKYANMWIPTPYLTHPYPNQRLIVK